MQYKMNRQYSHIMTCYSTSWNDLCSFKDEADSEGYTSILKSTDANEILSNYTKSIIEMPSILLCRFKIRSWMQDSDKDYRSVHLTGIPKEKGKLTSLTTSKNLNLILTRKIMEV
ncbi:hypothetical protein AVEN_191612-1 [Araneus ventricosus]|uniref:Uncharacterized protein n=1 Tax=Araneus ventricosus TaxID=182803 RepID=A0A4Y2Q8N3_ARAVE|nr:hypothetical protein AVEN_191612-1 [Araneus ventricosus]